MKSIVFIVCISSVFMIACGNSIPATDVPSVVLNSFKSKFPEALKVEWEKVDTHYEAEFELSSTDHAARLTTDGKLIIQKKEIHASNLPANIRSLLRNKFNTYFTDDIEWVEKDGLAYYQIELESNGKPDKKLVLSANGSESPAISFWD